MGAVVRQRIFGDVEFEISAEAHGDRLERQTDDGQIDAGRADAAIGDIRRVHIIVESEAQTEVRHGDHFAPTETGTGMPSGSIMRSRGLSTACSTRRKLPPSTFTTSSSRNPRLNRQSVMLMRSSSLSKPGISLFSPTPKISSSG